MEENIHPQPSGDRSGDGSGSFWKSLTGVLTGVSGLVIAVSGLVAGLNQAGWFGIHGAAPATAAPALAGHDAPATPSPAAAGESEFRVGQVSDHFAAVRAHRTITAKMVGSLEEGAHVMCGPRLPDVSDPARTWRKCSAAGGFVSARLLVPVGS